MSKRMFVLVFLAIISIFIISIMVGWTKQEKTPSSLSNTESLETEIVEDKKTKEENKQEPEEDLSEVKTEEAIIEDSKDNTFYISASKLNVRADSTVESKALGSLIKGKTVKVIDEVKNEKITWYKIKFENAENNNEGWISSEYTVKDRVDLLSEDYKELDFSPQDKVEEYLGNPRVEVKGIYLTINSAANALGRLDQLIEMAKETKINTFVIDVKDDYGNMLFQTEAARTFETNANNNAPIKDIEAFIKKLKDNNIYTIARIVSFKDPQYAQRYPNKAITDKRTGEPYSDSDKIIWVSAHDRQLWEYNIEVSKEAARAGFNEIQFDYVRFPASNGGKMDKYVDYRNELNESKPVTIQKYLIYAKKELSPLNVYISADIFGQVGSSSDDMGLGQYWEAVSNIVDYVCPMMYPSHYGNGVYGLSIPDSYPYETIDRGIKDALERNENIETPAIIRPWIQDFTAPWVKGYIEYGVDEVKAQIRALEENGVNEFLLWNANNSYTEEALK